MPKKTTIKIKQSAKFLKKRLSESKGQLSSDKIKTLLYIKEEKFHFQSDIAKDLERSEKTIRSWIQEYLTNGYMGLLKDKRGGNNTRTLSPKALKHASKVSKELSILRDMSLAKEKISFEYSLSSFIQFKSLFEMKIGEKIEYHALYSHFRRNHKVEFKWLRDYILKKRNLKKN